MSAASERLRAEFGGQDAIRDASLTTPEDILRYDDIAYGPHPQQVLDVYRPKALGGKLPVIINVHGGGWVYGDKDLYQYYTMSLAQRGFAVVNYTYRLAPETKFPASIEDTNAVFEWTRAHADTYGFDLDNLFAVGDSAGGHMLGLYSNICTNPEYAKHFSFGKAVGPAPKAVSLACGAYSIGTNGAEKRAQDIELMADLLEEVTPEMMELIDVRAHITPNFPETFFFTCTGDFLTQQAILLEGTLMENSVPHVMRFYGDAEHELGHVFHCNMRSEAARRCNDEQCDFFKKVMTRK